MKKNTVPDLTGFIDIIDHPSYMIHPDSRVWSKPRKTTPSKCPSSLGWTRTLCGRFMKPSICPDGYTYITLDKQRLSRSRLVAIHFIPNPNNYPMVKHLNEQRTDDREGNLEWCSNQQNVVHYQAKAYRLRDPDGNEIEIHNLAKFARDNCLDDANLRKVINGKIPSAKGYTQSKLAESLPLFTTQ